MASTSRGAFFGNVPFSITDKKLNQYISEITTEIKSLQETGNTLCKKLQELLQNDKNWTMPSFIGIPPGYTATKERKKEYLEEAKYAYEQVHLCVDLFFDALTTIDASNAGIPAFVPEVASASSLSSWSRHFRPMSAPLTFGEIECKLS